MHSVSVVIPAYNASATITETLASVQIQTVRPCEIIVVDDGSSDATPEIVARLAANDSLIRVIRQDNGGVAKARNTGVENARGDWIGALDADDVWHPRWIELMLAAANAAPQVPGLVYCWSRRIDIGSRLLSDMGRPVYQGKVFEQLVASNFLQNASAALLRRDAVLAVGGFDSGLRAAGAQGAEDIKLYLAIARVAPLAVAPYFLTGYRILKGSMSQSADRMRTSIELVLRDVERECTDLPPALLRLARMNYDFYVASIGLRGARLWVFLRYLTAGITRAPLSAAVLLSIHAVLLVHTALFVKRAHPDFKTLDPEYRQPIGLTSLLESYQTWVLNRTLRRRDQTLETSGQG